MHVFISEETRRIIWLPTAPRCFFNHQRRSSNQLSKQSNNVVQIRLSRREQETDQIASISSETTVWGRLQWDFRAGNHVTDVCVFVCLEVYVCVQNWKVTINTLVTVTERLFHVIFWVNLKEIILLSGQESFWWRTVLIYFWKGKNQRPVYRSSVTCQSGTVSISACFEEALFPWRLICEKDHVWRPNFTPL